MLALYIYQLLIYTAKKRAVPFLFARPGGNQDRRRLLPMFGSFDNDRQEGNEFLKELYCWIHARNHFFGMITRGQVPDAIRNGLVML